MAERAGSAASPCASARADSASSRCTMRRMTAPWPAYQATRLDCLTAKLKRVRQRSSAFSAIACPLRREDARNGGQVQTYFGRLKSPTTSVSAEIDELVHRHDALQRVAAVDEDAGVAREACRIAGNAGDARHAGSGERFRLCLGSGPRRIDDDAVEGVQLGRRERECEEVAPLGLDPLQSLRATQRRRSARRAEAGSIPPPEPPILAPAPARKCRCRRRGRRRGGTRRGVL